MGAKEELIKYISNLSEEDIEDSGFSCDHISQSNTQGGFTHTRAGGHDVEAALGKAAKNTIQRWEACFDYPPLSFVDLCPEAQEIPQAVRR